MDSNLISMIPVHNPCFEKNRYLFYSLKGVFFSTYCQTYKQAETGCSAPSWTIMKGVDMYTKANNTKSLLLVVIMNFGCMWHDAEAYTVNKPNRW